MKLSKFPPFSAVGMVSVYEHGDIRPFLKLRFQCYLHHREDIYSAALRDAKWKLHRAGVPQERIDELHFEFEGTDQLWAQEPTGVRRQYGHSIEAFFEHPDLKKRDILIRQRRLVPDDAISMAAMYGQPKAATQGVAA